MSTVLLNQEKICVILADFWSRAREALSRFVDWLVGRMVGWSVDWLVGMLVG